MTRPGEICFPDSLRHFPGEVIGYREDGRPIRIIAGGAPTTAERLAADANKRSTKADPKTEEPDDDENEPDEDENDDESDDDDKDKDETDEYQPPSKEEWERTKRRLAKANKEAQQRRVALAEKDTDDDKAKKAAAAEVEGKYKPMVVRAEARAQLAAMGLKGKPDRLLKLIDLSEIEVDEDGDITGLEEQLRDIKEDYEDLFDNPRQRNRRTRGDGGRQTEADQKPKRSADTLAKRLTG